MLLIVLGFVLSLPPVLLVVDQGTQASGAPVFYIYIFVIWAGMIILNGRLARRLDETAEAVEMAEAADLRAYLTPRPTERTTDGATGTAAPPPPSETPPPGARER